MKCITVDQQLLKSRLHYDKDTGIFVWINPTSKGIKKGTRAGCVSNEGYWDITFFGRRFRLHRLAWIYIHGSIDEGMQIDHINGDTTDSRLVNLRPVTQFGNQQNQRRARVDNTTGFMGVKKNGNNFIARIRANNKEVYLGSFRTPELAHAAYITAKRKLHTTCTI